MSARAPLHLCVPFREFFTDRKVITAYFQRASFFDYCVIVGNAMVRNTFDIMVEEIQGFEPNHLKK